MSSGPLLSPLYAILDPSQTRARPPEEVLKNLLEGGTKLLQLRAKNRPAEEFLRLALETRRQTSQSGCLFIVNDRIDIALAAGADGVHLGQEDLPLRAARKLMGEKLIGISTHDSTQAEEAEKGGADYIGFGPIFGTTTKQTRNSPRGLAMLREVRRVVKIPIVAIGGISEEAFSDILNAGADSAAMISDLLSAANIPEKVKRLLRSYQASYASSASSG